MLVDDGIEARAVGDLLAAVDDLAGALRALLDAVPERGHLAVRAHLDRGADADAAGLRSLLAARLAHPVAFSWGGGPDGVAELLRGGPRSSAFLVLTGAPADELDVPGRSWSFGRLQQLTALTELRALEGNDRPVLHLHLTDRARGLPTLLAIAKG